MLTVWVGQELRELATSDAILRGLQLTPMLSVAARVCSFQVLPPGSAGGHGSGGARFGSGRGAVSLAVPAGRFCVGGCDSGIPSGLPFLVDAPLFVREASPADPRRSLFLTPSPRIAAAAVAGPSGGGGRPGAGNRTSSGDRGGVVGGSSTDPALAKIAAEQARQQQRAQGGSGGGGPGNGDGGGPDGSAVGHELAALGRWNVAVVEAVMVDLVPDLLESLRDTLRSRFLLEPSSLYVH
jgi:hypothetical protein